MHTFFGFVFFQILEFVWIISNILEFSFFFIVSNILELFWILWIFLSFKPCAPFAGVGPFRSQHAMSACSGFHR